MGVRLEGSQTVTLAEAGHFFEVRLDLFDGPIDLLLHLVKMRELPIEKVSLAAVSAQYLECVESIRHFDLEIAGEYLLIAATLLSIKSSVLLGEPATLVEDADGNLIDPHEELLQRLRDAAVYKDSAGQLGRMPILGMDVFSAPSLLDEIEGPPVSFKNHDPILLGQAFRKLLEGAKDIVSFDVHYDPVTIVQRMMEIIDSIKTSGGVVGFESLVPEIRSRASIITTFIALLELCRRQAIQIRQDESFEKIYVALAGSGDPLDLGDFKSEFDGAEQVVNA